MAGAPDHPAPGAEHEVQVLLGCSLPFPGCQAPGQARLPPTGRPPLRLLLSPPLSTILCSHCLPGFASTACLTPSFRGFEAPTPPAAAGSCLRERTAHCHCLPIGLAPASASLSARRTSRASVLPTARPWLASEGALCSRLLCILELGCSYNWDQTGSPYTGPWAVRLAAGSSTCPSPAWKVFSPGHLPLVCGEVKDAW